MTTHQAPNLQGQRFHRLLVRARTRDKRGRTTWLCTCDCGSELVVPTYRLLHGQRSCGCIMREHTANVAAKRAIEQSKPYVLVAKNGKWVRIW